MVDVIKLFEGQIWKDYVIKPKELECNSIKKYSKRIHLDNETNKTWISAKTFSSNILGGVVISDECDAFDTKLKEVMKQSNFCWPKVPT